MSERTSLPDGFAHLEPFVAIWAVPGLAVREAVRGQSSEAERRAFYDAIGDDIPAILDQLSAKPLAELDEAEQRLLRLALAFTHVALAVEIQEEAEPVHRDLRAHLVLSESNPAL